MGALTMVARTELRGRWRTLVALVLLAGLPAGVAIAAAIGASRTNSAIDRLVAATRPPQIFMVPDFQQTKLPFDDIARLPVVSEAILFHGYGSLSPGLEDLEIGAIVGQELEPGRTHLISGRIPAPGSADEATINYRAAERYQWKVGRTLSLTLTAAGSDLTGDAPPKPGPTVRANIVGISANPGDFVGIAGPGITFGPGFARAYDARSASIDLYTFSLARGRNDLRAFDDGLRKLTGGKGILYVEGSSGTGQVRRSFRIQGAALWVISVSLAIVAALIFAQSFSRHALMQAGENGQLRALGVTRRDLSLFAVMRAGAAAAAATAVAAVLAAGLSPLTPLGTARLAEPHPGFSLPGTAFAGGLGVAFVLVFALALGPSLLAARALARQGLAEHARPSMVARLMSLVTRRAAPAVGARFALEPGRGVTAVPVRTSLTASITGIVALIAALIAGASLQHLLSSPPLYGWNWDLTLSGAFAEESQDLRDLIADPDVAAASVGAGGEGALFQVGRARMNGIAADAVKGRLGPTLLAGRVPVGTDEIALGPKSIQAAKTRLDGTVTVGLAGKQGSRALRVVGEIVLPFDDDVTSVGEGLWMTLAAARTFDPDVPREAALVRLRPGADRKATIGRLQKRFPGEALTQAIPRTISSFGRMSNLPLGLAAMLGALAAGTLAHMLSTSIRRRRRDLAILKTIGFSRGQLRSAVGWQAVVFASVALAISIPLGIVIGRWTWRVVARYGGFASAPIVPVIQIAVAGAVALAVAAALAMLPARAAARTRPALVLRSE